MLGVGSVVCSIKGHDFGRFYVILKIDGEFAYLCDGKYRTLSKLKKKRIKHLKDTYNTCLVDDFSKLHDFQIATMLKNVINMHKK